MSTRNSRKKHALNVSAALMIAAANQITISIRFPHKLLYLLFEVLQIIGTLMEWNRIESHDCSELFWLLQFSSRGSQNRHLTLPIFTWLEMRRHILCIQCTLHWVLFWRVNRYISTYTYYMVVNARVGQNQRVKTLQKHT
jgi:hypothetical protein